LRIEGGEALRIGAFDRQQRQRAILSAEPDRPAPAQRVDRAGGRTAIH